MLSPQRLLAAAARYQPALLSFLQELVRTPSVNGQDNEAAVAALVQREAQRLGLPSRLVARDAARPNVLAAWGDGARGFALIAHTDTVAAGSSSAWSHPPFSAALVETPDGQRLVGRGAADNKAGLACGLYTLVLMRDEGLLDPADVRLIVAGVVDEESGASSALGVRYLLDEGELPVQSAVYTYTSDIVCVGHRGLLRLRLAAHGRAVHSGSDAWSRGEEGVNAVTGLSAALLALEQVQLPAPAHPAFDHLSFTITPGTLMKGGAFESMVPAHAEAMVDVRLLPGQAPDDVLQRLREVIAATTAARPGLSIDVQVKNRLPAVALPIDHALAQDAARWARAISGDPWPIRGAGPANEGYMLIDAGIATLCGFGPRGGGAHAADEWVATASLSQTVAIYAGLIHDTLTSPA